MRARGGDENSCHRRTGFIGGHVVRELLDRGHDVAVLHRGTRAGATAPPVRTVIGDRRGLGARRGALAALGPEVVVDVILWLDDAYDKVPAERVLMSDPDAEATILRLPMVYGPGDPLHRLHPLIKRMDDGRPAILLPEDRARWRGPRGYVEDVAAAIALAATSDQARGRIYNVAEGDTLSELEWAQRVAAIVGWPGRILTAPRERTPSHLVWPGNFDQHWVASSERIRRELGYAEQVPRDEGLRRTIAWERAHPPETDPRQFDYEAEDRALAS